LFGEIGAEFTPANLVIRELPKDMFYYGRRFEGEGLLNSIFILK
jgi:hypothetical protein